MRDDRVNDEILPVCPEVPQCMSGDDVLHPDAEVVQSMMDDKGNDEVLSVHEL